jgi:hypothetical protein
MPDACNCLIGGTIITPTIPSIVVISNPVILDALYFVIDPKGSVGSRTSCIGGGIALISGLLSIS